jgi:Nif-specific regulatory protein
MLDTRTKLGAYGLLKKLGEGPHGTTWLARRDGSREPQALKVLGLAEGAAPRLDAALRSLQADLARLGPEHPNVVVPAEAGGSTEEGREPIVFFASEYVDGPDLLKFTARAPWSTILEVVVSALRGLEAIHARGLVHGHVCANNVVVAGQGPRKTARLLDPGLAREFALTRGLAAGLSWAPEVLRGDPLDRRADLYDLGVLLFECATREPLFVDEAGAALEGEALERAHRHEPPRKARDLKRSVPVAVESLIEALLKKDPADRPASANAVIRELNRTANKRFSTETREAHLPTLLQPRLTGRQEELDELRAWTRAASAPAPAEPPAAIVALTGDLGAGRTRLLQELRRCVLDQDVAPEAEAEVKAPAQAEEPADEEGREAAPPVEGAARGARWIQPRGPSAREVVSALVLELLGDDESPSVHGPLARLAPWLRPLLPTGVPEALLRPAPRLPAARERQRLAEAAAALLIEVARARPLVLVVDDAQRADELLVDVLRFVARDLHAARAAQAAQATQAEDDEPSDLPAKEDAKLLVLLALAPDELYGRSAGQGLEALLAQDGVRELSLEPLEPQALAAVLASALGRDLTDVRALVQRLADGVSGGEPATPAPALHALADLAERQALPPPDGAWTVDDAQTAATLADPTIVGLARRRLASLRVAAPDAARLLVLLAALDGPARLDLLTRALDLDAAAVLSAARELERRGLVATLRSPPAWIVVAQSQLPDALCQSLDGAELAQAHEALGRAAADAAGAPDGLRAKADASDGELDALAARHLLRGTSGASAAAPWALAAGRAALERHEPAQALELVEAVVRGLESPGAQAAGAAGRASLLGCQLVLAEALLALGKTGQARTAAHKASALAHEARAGREMAQALLVAQEAHRALRDPAQAKAACEEALRLCRSTDWRRGVVLALWHRGLAEEATGDREEALASLEEARKACVALGDGPELAGVLRDTARLRAASGDLAAAIDACDRAIELDEEGEPPGDLSASLRLRAELERAKGDLGRALELARRAVEAAREAFDTAGVALALGCVAEVLAARGERAEARTRLLAALALWDRIGDGEGAAEARLRLGRTFLAEGRLGEAEDQLQRAAQAFKTMNQRVRTSEATTSLAEAHLLRGDITRARDWADRALEEAKGADQAKVQVEVQRLRAELALVVGDLAGAEELAERAAEEAARAAHQPVECQARIALGLARLRRGRLVDAERDLREALELARERGDPALAAQARLAIAQVHLVRGEPAGTLAELERARDAAQEHRDAHLEVQSLIALGRTHVFLGQTRRAGQLLEMARQRAQELDLGLALADATLLRAEALLEQAARAATIAQSGGQSGCQSKADDAQHPNAGEEDPLGRAATLLDEAERLAASRRGLRAEIDLARADLLLLRGDATGGRERAEAALEASRITGDAITAARAEALLARARLAQGRGEEALSGAERAVAAAEAVRDGEARAMALLERGRAALALGQALPAAQDLREATSHIRGIWAALPEDLRRDYQEKSLVRAILGAAQRAIAAAEAEVQARPPAPAAAPATLTAAAPLPALAHESAIAAVAAAAATAGEDGAAARADTLESLRDPLTTLFNHTFFTAQLETEIKRCVRHARPLAVLKVNIDRFKLVRELYGPKVGKRVIRDISQVLLRNVRDVDIVARYFGDEFEVLLPDTDQRGALLTAERIRTAVEAMRFEHEDEKIELTLTIGVAVFPRDAKDKDALICRVDEALYNARSRGSNTVFSFGGPEDEKIETSPELREVDALMLSREGRTILSMLSRLMNQELDVDRVIELVTGMVVEATRGERGFLLLKGPDGEFVFRHGRGIDDKVINSPELKISNSIARDVARTGEAVHVQEAVEDGRFKDFKSVMDLKLRSIICAPIKDKDGEVLGVIYVDHNQVARNFSPEDLNFLAAIAQKVSIPIKNSKMLRETADKLEVAEARLRSASQQLQTKYRYDSIIGRTDAMMKVFKLLDRIVETSHSVVIHGESGTGKELIARAIHYNGARKQKPFVAENCAALSDTLLEAELFGHVKGAFTGADRDSKGLFELANGGTLFLDEIGDMSERMQKKLLRVLQEGEVRPVGGKRVFHVDVRIISASNKDLKQMVVERKFREDLYYRLNVITVNLPPLRERRDDIVLLVDYFIKKHAEAEQPRTIDRETMRLLANYDWPGNVRELENEINRIVAMSDDVVSPDMLSPKIREGTASAVSKVINGLAKYYGRPLKEVEYDFMKDIIIYTLEQTNWHRTKAAKILKVPTSTLFNKMKKYGIG